VGAMPSRKNLNDMARRDSSIISKLIMRTSGDKNHE
jgi:hypothetical protein